MLMGTGFRGVFVGLGTGWSPWPVAYGVPTLDTACNWWPVDGVDVTWSRALVAWVKGARESVVKWKSKETEWKFTPSSTNWRAWVELHNFSQFVGYLASISTQLLWQERYLCLTWGYILEDGHMNVLIFHPLWPVIILISANQIN